MINLFDKFTVKRRYFIVKEKNMIEVLKMIQTALSDGVPTGCASVGNCGLAKEPELWFVHVDLTTNKWRTLLKECKNKHYQLVIKESPENMYFEKIKES